MNKKVYYVVKLPGIGYLRTNRHAGDSTFNRSEAEFPTVTRALERIGSATRGFVGFEIIRVEETISAPRRELVTTGDLSLLDGPVVVTDANSREDRSYFIRDNFLPEDSWTRDINRAAIFANQTDAIKAVETVLFTRSFRIVPIREIPGTPTIVETVLA